MTVDELLAQQEDPAQVPEILPSPIDVGKRVAGAVLPDTGSGIGALMGGQLGSMAGGAVPIPGASFLGGVAGAGLGGGAGVLFDIIRHQGENLGRSIVEKATGKNLGGPVAPSAGQDLATIPQAMQQGATGQALGAAAGGAVNTLLGPFARRMTPERQANVATWEKEGIPYSAGQATESPVLNMLEGVSAKMPSSAGHTVDFIKSQLSAQQEALTRWTEQVSPGAEKDLLSGGERAWQTVKKSREQAELDGTQQYRAVYNMTGGRNFPTTNTMHTVDGLMRPRGMGAMAAPATNRTYSALSEMIEESKRATQVNINGRSFSVASLPPHIQATLAKDPQMAAVLRAASQPATDIETMHLARSKLLKIVRDSQRSPRYSSSDAHAASLLAASLDQDMQALSQDPKLAHVYPLLRAADDNWRVTVGETFKDPNVIQSIWQKAKQGEKDKILGLIFRENGSVGPVRAFERAVGTGETRRAAATWMHDLINRKAVANGMFSSDQFATALDPKNVSPQYLEATFGKGHADDMQAFVRGMQQIKRASIGGANPSETGRTLIAYHQITTVGSIAAGVLTQAGHAGAGGTLASILAVPWAMSRVLLSPTGAKWLSGAFKPGLTTQAMISLGTRLAAIAQFPSQAEMPPPPEGEEEVKAERQAAPFASAAFPQ